MGHLTDEPDAYPHPLPSLLSILPGDKSFPTNNLIVLLEADFGSVWTTAQGSKKPTQMKLDGELAALLSTSC